MTALFDAQRVMASAEPDRLSTALRHAQESAQLAADAGRSDIECEALETVALSLRPADLDGSMTVLRRMLAIAEGGGWHHWRLRALNELGAAEMLRYADGSRLHEAYRLAVLSGAVATAGGVRVNLAALHAMCGRHAEVIEVASRAEDMLARVGIEPVKAAAVRLMDPLPRSV